MAIASPIQNQKAKGQPANRRYQRYRDVHNRRWGSVVENKTGDPVGTIDPIGWSAPWMPHPKYITLTRDEDGEIEVGRLTIDYKQMLRDIREERKEYQERLEFYAQAMFGESAGEKIENPPASLLRLLKRKPAHPEIVVAAMKGDRWVLGLEKGECPDYLKPYFAKQLADAQLAADVDDIDLDPDFVAGLEAKFDAARIKPRDKSENPLGNIAEQARRDAEREAEAEAARTSASAKRSR